MKLRLPHLTPVAKGQLWGMGVGLGTALLAVEHTQVGYRIFFVGAAAAWVASEYFLARRLVGADAKTLTLAVLSGIAIPWTGFLIAYGLNAIAP